LHGHFEVVGHAHRTHGKGEAVGQGDEGLESRPGRFWRTCRTDRHQAPDVKAEAAEVVDQCGNLPFGGAMLLGLAADVHLHKDGSAGCSPGDLLGGSDSIDGLPEADEVGDLAHLVALDSAEVVPANVPTGERSRLVRELVRTVLADIGQAVVDCLIDGVGPKILGDGDERDRFQVTAGGADPIPNFGETVCYSRHTTMAWRDSSLRARQEK